jgi:thiamine biosynthesis lipoprotein
MDTVVRIAVYDRNLPVKSIRQSINDAFKCMKAIEVKTSIHNDSSEVTLVNQNAGLQEVKVSLEIITILNESIRISKETDGAFDVTVGILKQLWSFESDEHFIPESKTIFSQLPYVNYRKITVNNRNVFLHEPGMQIDLGGVAKGYIVDRGIQVLKDAGIEAGIIDAGGDLRIFGHHPYRQNWRIGIRHPREPEALYGILEIPAISVTTSGDYERYFEMEGKRYHHILDPKTGAPASGCISVTILAENALSADAYATAVFVLGPVKGLALINKISGIEGMILVKEKSSIRSIMSEQFEKYFKSDSGGS